MTLKIIKPTVLLILLILFGSAHSIKINGVSQVQAASATQPDSAYMVESNVMCAAVTSSSSAGFLLLGGAGQMTGGECASASYGLIGGFWEFSEDDDGCCGKFTGGYTGNTNCDTGGLRDLADITRLIDNVYITKVELCCLENGNINGDAGGLIDLADITKLIDHVYISKTETAACE